MTMGPVTTEVATMELATAELATAELATAELGMQPSSGERPRAAAARVEGSCRPFVKWAGGKRQLLPELQRYVPAQFARYIEPFVGGGALFFELSSRLGSSQHTPHALLADVNQRLIRTYRGVRDSVQDVIELLGSY